MTRASGRAARLTRIRDRLRTRPHGVVELAQLEGVGRRSIERDLHTLADELGDRLEADDQHRYSIAVRSAGLNEIEALALYSAARLLQHTGVGERHYRSAMVKLAQQVPEPARTALLNRTERLKTAARDRVLDLVAQAWFQQRVLRCRYRSVNSGATERRDLEVYFVELGRRNHEAYALAFDRTKRQKVLVFKLARMLDVQLLNDTYVVPTDFDPEAALNDAFGVVVGDSVEVSVRVTPAAALPFKELAEGSLISEESQPDGGIIACLQGTLDTQGRAIELLPWLVGWGGAVEVLSPQHVRDAVRDAHAAALELYRGGAAG